MAELHLKHPKVVVIANSENVIAYVSQELAQRAIDAEECFSSVEEALHGLPTISNNAWLFIVEVRDLNALEEMYSLHRSFPGRPIVALLGDGWDARRLLEPMRRGASQIVLLPGEAGELNNALGSVLMQFGYAERASRLISIIGVHGGCGATTLAINLGAELAASANGPMDCLLLEKNWAASNFTTYLGLTPKYTTNDLNDHHDDMDVDFLNAVCHRMGKGLSLIPAPKEGGLAGYRLGRDLIRRFYQLCKQIADVIMIDMAYMADPDFLNMMDEFDQHILVGNHTPAGIDALRTVHQQIVDHGGANVLHVVNRFDAGFDRLGTDRLTQLLGERWLPIPEDHLVQTAANGGICIAEINPESEALAAIRQIAYDVIGLKPARPSSLVHRLRSWLPRW